jgi:hypothetical protein
MRDCKECTLCCVVSEIPELGKSAYLKCKYVCESPMGSCSVHSTEIQPERCKSFDCLWKQGYGEDKSRPDKIGILPFVSNFNGGYWIFIVETIKDAVVTIAKDFLITITKISNIPLIISDYREYFNKDDKGDRVIIKNNLLYKSKQLHNGLLTMLSDDTGLYKLRIS